ncbi:hypothetical protein AVEN_216652-1 [Araneus ventricosus]|uniref:Uncharacterized protein n=1 Tax=Araneus ventricosus TaxID=182803 RepID=A0A4Y2DTP6_ARAVE|nr:hypothetical protein AVEN_216652-1 [Araneus ventricosus]
MLSGIVPPLRAETSATPGLVEPIVKEIASLAKIRGLEVDKNDIDELVEEHNQDLTTEELMKLHCVHSKKLWRRR